MSPLEMHQGYTVEPFVLIEPKSINLYSQLAGKMSNSPPFCRRDVLWQCRVQIPAEFKPFRDYKTVDQ